MKAFVLLALALASYFVDVESRMTMAQLQVGLKTVKKPCMAKSGVSKEVLDATHNGDFANDKNLMCFYHCVLGMVQMLKDGKFNPEIAARQAEDWLPLEILDRVKAMSTHCSAQITSDDACEGAWQYAKCNYETDKEIFMFP